MDAHRSAGGNSIQGTYVSVRGGRAVDCWLELASMNLPASFDSDFN